MSHCGPSGFHERGDLLTPWSPSEAVSCLRICPRRKHRADRVAAVLRAAVDNFLPLSLRVVSPGGGKRAGLSSDSKHSSIEIGKMMRERKATVGNVKGAPSIWNEVGNQYTERVERAFSDTLFIAMKITFAEPVTSASFPSTFSKPLSSSLRPT
jgi:hypothetical protein